MDFNAINNCIKSNEFQVRPVLEKFSFLDDNLKQDDSLWTLSSYYLFGKNFPCKNLLQIGFGIGLFSAFYLLGNPDVEKYLAIEQTEGYFSSRLGISNIKRVWKKPFKVECGYVDKILDKYNNWDIALINDHRSHEVHMLWLKSVWSKLSDAGFIFMDLTSLESKKSYDNFCSIKRIKPFTFYSQIGVLQKGGVSSDTK